MAATQIDVSATVQTRTAAIRLRPDAAASWDQVSDAVAAAHGWRLTPTDGHRSIALQTTIFLQRYEVRATGAGPYGDVRYWQGRRYVRVRGAAAAVPGTSNHGGGIAVDAGAGVNTYGTRWNQFAAIATAHGWSHAEGKSVNEPWHWVYTGAAPAPGGGIAADGRWGKATTSALQRHLGTHVDGIVSSQYAARRASNPGIVDGWEWVTKPKGSPMIAALQRILGVAADGIAGPATFAALQRRMGTHADGVLSLPSPAVAEMQRRLNNNTL